VHDGCAADHPIAGASSPRAPASASFSPTTLACRPQGDPELVLIATMCAYAIDIALGLLPGPLTAVDACRYARAALIPDELLERPGLDVERAAEALGVPAGWALPACLARSWSGRLPQRFWLLSRLVEPARQIAAGVRRRRCSRRGAVLSRGD
jgi:hypothetical protein